MRLDPRDTGTPKPERPDTNAITRLEIFADRTDASGAARLGAVDHSARALGIERLCENAEEFIELVLNHEGRVLYMNPSLTKLHGQDARSILDVLNESSQAPILMQASGSSLPRTIQFCDARGAPFSARVLTIDEGRQWRIVGLLTTFASLKELEELYSINNEFAVTSRELSQQRQKLEALVAEASAKEAELLSVNQAIGLAARTDMLTGLYNRRALENELVHLLEGAMAAGLPVSVVLLDLDHFKDINDRFGHHVGDLVLIEVSAILRRSARRDDLAIRLGGEELLLVLQGAGHDRAFDLANGLRERIHTVTVELVDRTITASIGVATWLGRQETVAALLARADAAMYRAKALGRDQCVLAKTDQPCGTQN